MSKRPQVAVAQGRGGLVQVPRQAHLLGHLQDAVFGRFFVQALAQKTRAVTGHPDVVVKGELGKGLDQLEGAGQALVDDLMRFSCPTGSRPGR